MIGINAADVARLDLGLTPTHAPTAHEELFPTKYTGGIKMLDEEKIQLAKIYAENEERNAHTENVLLLAENFGTTVQIKSVKNILKMRNTRGYIKPSEANLLGLISRQHFDNIRAQYLEVEIDPAWRRAE